MPPLSFRAAFFKAITQVLRGDVELMSQARGGVWYGRAPLEAPMPFLAWRMGKGGRERTFGTEAFRFFDFEVFAVWDDSEGANFAHGDALSERAHYLLDGTERGDDERVISAFNALLHPNGWHLMALAEIESIAPEDKPIGQDAGSLRYSMGYSFHAKMRRVPVS